MKTRTTDSRDVERERSKIHTNHYKKKEKGNEFCFAALKPSSGQSTSSPSQTLISVTGFVKGFRRITRGKTKRRGKEKQRGEAKKDES